MRIQRRLLGAERYYVVVDGDGRLAGAARTFVELRRGDLSTRPSLLEQLAGPEVHLLAPVAPSKIVCVGLNYRRHAEEMGMALPPYPLLFLKPGTAVIGPDRAIRLPPTSQEVHHEGELAVVIGRRAARVPAGRAAEHILGYTVMNDVTARDIQRREQKYTHAKGFDTFAPLGPAVVSDLDPEALQLEVRVNGEVRQRSGCDDLIFKVPELVEFASSVMTLLPGDVISTGTPSGVGPIVDGDVVEVAISGIGTLCNPVRGSTGHA